MFIDIVFFGRLAETINTYTSKGSPILIEGRLSQNTWEQEGTKRSKHEIIVENFQFLGSKGDKQAPTHDDNSGRFNAPSDLPDEEDLPF
jgi:single-strand DNA-binding protein